MISAKTRADAIKYARRFAWGFDNAAFGSDDWRCGRNIRVELGLDDNDDPMAYEDEIEPCDCPECDGASHREWSKKLPLSIRIALNLASSAPEQGK
ncbi:hypothetical protein SAMN05216337_1001226 [Bradyrhizobium brasilense]|uniref:Uncharacterized protein n=1 Tax=Bradyrhizobium brasilense TaxID=1419277 RepID=A0A1G6IR58_9BRAD|nr:hypothetical protein [Bradyrhizobium brasilense]SDC08921.1 hypothetical protein SAMN05216337_1001226 [Bradyrhizobium brasilense]